MCEMYERQTEQASDTELETDREGLKEGVSDDGSGEDII